MDLLATPGFLVGLVLGILIGWLSLWSYLNPAIGKSVARICAVIVLGIGVQWVVTPLYDQFNGEQEPRYTSPFGYGGYGSALGWGAGCLVVGGTFLGLSFLRTAGKETAPKAEDKPTPS